LQRQVRLHSKCLSAASKALQALKDAPLIALLGSWPAGKTLPLIIGFRITYTLPTALPDAARWDNHRELT
jgi:hypothetical protein